jgi:Uri superfamily endonuclease
VPGDGVDTSGGVYTLLIRLDAAAEIGVGALGTLRFDAGRYAYTGSAFGPGGFARVDRHRELAAGDREARHWHVDYLLGHPDATLAGVVTSPGVDAECAVAREIEGRRVPGFGASDCSCESHLAVGQEAGTLEASVRDAHRAVRN